MSWLALLALLLAAPSASAEPPRTLKTWDGCTLLSEKHHTLGVSFTQALAREGIEIIRTADSMKKDLFQNWREACWVETNLGVLDVVFFPGATDYTRVERLEASFGLERSRVTSPDGQSVVVQGLETYDFTGPRSWVVTANKRLAGALKRVRDLP